MRIKIPVGVIIVIALVAVFAFYVISGRSKYVTRLRAMEHTQNRKVIEGIVTEVSKVSSPSLYYVYYAYHCNGKSYSDKLKLPEFKDTSILHMLPQKKISVIISVDDCSFSYPILTKTDFKKFNMSVADSSKMIIPL